MPGYDALKAQPLPVVRVGVMDYPDGSLLRGAELAAKHINETGGMVNAAGIPFELQFVVQSPDNVPSAVANFQQAGVIAILGPQDAELLFSHYNLLTNLQIPIFTPATDDTLTALDRSRSFIRIRARDSLQAQSLAHYLINEMDIRTLVTVQLDLDSLTAAVTFTRTATQLGVTPDEHLLALEQPTLEIVADIFAESPEAVVVYGPSLEAAELYTSLRQFDWPGYFVYNQAESIEFRENVQESLLEGIISISTWSPTFGDEDSVTFLFAYLDAFGEVPNAVDAAAYDALQLLRNAFARPGDLITNVLELENFDGVQGTLNTEQLPQQDISANTVVLELGRFGAPVAEARYLDDEQIPLQVPTFVPPTPTAPPTPTSDSVYLTVLSPLQNVRTGPGLNYPILGQLRQGTQARVVGANTDFSWVVIEFRGTLGWMFRDILDITGNTRTVPVIAAPPSPIPPPTNTPIPSPTHTPVPLSLIITSPLPGNQVSGTTVVYGSAIHPAFQYFSVEVGPDPNPQNVWIPINDQNSPVLNGVLATWNTRVVADGIYQLRLTVLLQNGTQLATIANGIRVNNAPPTPAPARTTTPVVAPPIAAFAMSASVGNAPFTVQFTNHSFGNVSNLHWDFGDGTFSTQPHPVHTYSAAGQYTVIVTVTGAGGQDTAISFVTVLQPTATPFPTATLVPTITPTFTSTATLLPTNTPTVTTVPLTNTQIPSATIKPTDTPTATVTDTNTLTVTPSATETATVTEVPPTLTETVIPTSASTETPTETATATSTETPTETATATPTDVPPTLTGTPTSTETPTATATPTDVPPTSTETPTSTATETPVPPTLTTTPTSTETPTETATATETPVPPTATETEIPTETQTAESTLVSVPIVPDLSADGVQQHLRSIYEAGLSQGKRPTIFTLAGDAGIAQQGFLSPFADAASYTLDATSQQLQSIIDWYNVTPLEDGTSFNHNSLAVNSSWTAQDLVNPSNADSNLCEGGENPLECELRLTQPGVVIIGVGYNDALQMTNPNPFRNALEQAVNTAQEQGVIPVLLTIPPIGDEAVAAHANTLNEVILEVALDNQIPLINSWRHFISLPDNGLGSEGFTASVAPTGAGDLTADAVNTYGLNALNFDVLTTFDMLRSHIFPDAAIPQ